LQHEQPEANEQQKSFTAQFHQAGRQAKQPRLQVEEPTTQPSQDDFNLTRKIKDGAHLLDLRLYDHIIVAGNTFYSFMDNGYI
jgi:hypothetical protein